MAGARHANTSLPPANAHFPPVVRKPTTIPCPQACPAVRKVVRHHHAFFHGLSSSCTHSSGQALRRGQASNNFSGCLAGSCGPIAVVRVCVSGHDIKAEDCSFIPFCSVESPGQSKSGFPSRCWLCGGRRAWPLLPPSHPSSCHPSKLPSVVTLWLHHLASCGQLGRCSHEGSLFPGAAHRLASATIRSCRDIASSVGLVWMSRPRPFTGQVYYVWRYTKVTVLSQ